MCVRCNRRLDLAKVSLSGGLSSTPESGATLSLSCQSSIVVRVQPRRECGVAVFADPPNAIGMLNSSWRAAC